MSLLIKGYRVIRSGCEQCFIFIYTTKEQDVDWGSGVDLFKSAENKEPKMCLRWYFNLNKGLVWVIKK